MKSKTRATYYIVAILAFAKSATAQNDIKGERALDIMCSQMPPSATQNINTTLYSYSSERPTTPHVITTENRYAYTGLLCNSTQVYLLIHGWLQDFSLEQYQQIKAALLSKYKNSIVILLDWKTGAWCPYTQAVVNIGVVADEACLILKTLAGECGFDRSKLTIIGHSLGAQLAGFLGACFTGIGTILGWDPAGPCFETKGPQDRLDPSDAKHVEVVHTNAGFLGTEIQCGHVDWYPNGGQNQPGCPSCLLSVVIAVLLLPFEGLPEAFAAIACSHSFSMKLLLAGIQNSSPCIGYRCSNFDDYTMGKCFYNCQGSMSSSCRPIDFGLENREVDAINGPFYFETTSEPISQLRVLTLDGFVNENQDDWYPGLVTACIYAVCATNSGKQCFQIINGYFTRGQKYTAYFKFPGNVPISSCKLQIGLYYYGVPVWGPKYFQFNRMSIGYVNSDMTWQTKSFLGCTLLTSDTKELMLSELTGKNIE